MKTLRRIARVSAIAYLLGVSACASHRPNGTHRAEVERDALVTVTHIDVANRLVTVRGASGEPFTVYVDESNRSFPQAAVGDQVRLRFVESIALRLTKSGSTTGLSIKDETAQAQPGRPRGATATEITSTVRIESVQHGGEVVTFTGPRGPRTVEVHDPAMRDYIRTLKPGDKVEVTYKEALALSLEKVRP